MLSMISLPDRMRQEQRLKELNQQLEEQITLATCHYPIADFKTDRFGRAMR